MVECWWLVLAGALEVLAVAGGVSVVLWCQDIAREFREAGRG